MKTTKAFITAILCLTAVSCAKEIVSASGIDDKEKIETLEYVTFTASLSNSDTKTYLDGAQVKWESTDEIDLWFGTFGTEEMTNGTYIIKSIDSDDARIATFQGFALKSNNYVAVYPRSPFNGCSKKGKITTAFPTEQNAKAGSFDSGANVAVAYTNSSVLNFKNMGGIVALKISSAGGHTIKSIRLTGTSALSGEVEIKRAEKEGWTGENEGYSEESGAWTKTMIPVNEPLLSSITGGVNFVKLNCGDGIADTYKGLTDGYSDESGEWSATKAGTKSVFPSGGNTYYLVSIPGSHTDFAMTFVDNDGRTAVAKSNYAFTINRNSNTLIANISLTDGNFKEDETVFINEIFCHEDKIELYNPGDDAVDLSGYYFTKDDEKYWAIPAGTIIQAKGYKVFTGGQTDCSFGPTWGVSGDKGFELKLSNGKTVDVIDNTGEGKLIVGETETMGRKTDGSNKWVVFSSGTIYEDGVCDGDNSKGTVKGETPASDSPLRLNELDGTDKFIEIFNTGSVTVSLEGVKLYKDGGTLIWTGASGYSVVAGGYVLLYSEDVVASHPSHDSNLIFSSGLSPKKTLKMEIKDAENRLIDTFTRGSEPWGSKISECSDSFGRTPDGTGGWQLINSTPGTANGASKGNIPQN